MSETLLPGHLEYRDPFPCLSRRLRLGIVGGGRIASTQSATARMSGYWDVVAGALSSDPAKVRARATQWYIPAERSYESFHAMAVAEAARGDGVDAVMITTPNHLHQRAASAFLEAGIHVLCDKPLTNTLDEALQLQQQVHDSRQVFGVSYTMSCFPMVRQARELVLAGEVGDINQIHVEFMQGWMVPADVAEAGHVKWRLNPEQAGPTSCTGDIATHAAHLASFVTGLELTDIRAEMHICGAPKALEDTVFMMTRYAGKVPGTLLATRLATGNRGGLRLRVFGSKAGVEWDMEQPEFLKLCRYGEPDQLISRGHGHGVGPAVERMVRNARGFSEGLIEAWANLYTEFALAVAAHNDTIVMPENYLLYPGIEDGVAGVRFIEAVVESSKLGGEWVRL